MLQVLGRTGSINVRKVRWLCAELELPYEHQEWGAGDLALHSAPFLALNPNALVPVIRDGDFVLWESNTICRYLASRGGRGDLLPLAARERARVEQWMDWQATELNAAWRYAFMALVRKGAAYTDPAAIESSIQGWNRLMHLLDQQLAQTGAHVVGLDFTLADVVLGLSIHRWLMTPMQRPMLPAVAAYRERLLQRPGFLLYAGPDMP